MWWIQISSELANFWFAFMSSSVVIRLLYLLITSLHLLHMQWSCASPWSMVQPGIWGLWWCCSCIYIHCPCSLFHYCASFLCYFSATMREQGFLKHLRIALMSIQSSCPRFVHSGPDISLFTFSFDGGILLLGSRGCASMVHIGLIIFEQ